MRTHTSSRPQYSCESQGAQSSSPVITPRKGFLSVAAPPPQMSRFDFDCGSDYAAAALLRAAATTVVAVAAVVIVVVREDPGPPHPRLLRLSVDTPPYRPPGNPTKQREKKKRGKKQECDKNNGSHHNPDTRDTFAFRVLPVLIPPATSPIITRYASLSPTPNPKNQKRNEICVKVIPR